MRAVSVFIIVHLTLKLFKPLRARVVGRSEADEVLRLMNPWMSPGCPRGGDVPLGN